MIPLRRGDVLLYSAWIPVSDWLIKLHTGSRIVHVEVVSTPTVVGSARFKGVDWYPFEPANLAYILRPRRPVDMVAANTWFETVRGQPYGYLGLLGYFNADLQTDSGSWSCSKLATRYLRAGGFDPFSGFISGGVEPGDFLKVPGFHQYEV
jgi:hypothetical protein